MFQSIKSQNNITHERIMKKSSVSFRVENTDGSAQGLLTGLSIFGGSSKMMVGITLSCGDLKIAAQKHRYIIPRQPADDPAAQGLVPGSPPHIEQFIFDKPIELQFNVNYTITADIAHDGAAIPNQHYMVTPQKTARCKELGFEFSFDGQGNAGDWLQVGVRSILFVGPQKQKRSIVKISSKFWSCDEEGRHQCLSAYIELLLWAWKHAEFILCMQILRLVSTRVGDLIAEGLQQFELNMTIIESMMAIISGAPQVKGNGADLDSTLLAGIVSASKQLYSNLCTNGFPDVNERRMVTKIVFARAFSLPDEGSAGMDPSLVSEFLRSTADALFAGLSVLDLFPDPTQTPSAVITQLLDLSCQGNVAVRSAAARLLTAVGSSLSLAISLQKGSDEAEPLSGEPEAEAPAPSGDIAATNLRFLVQQCLGACRRQLDGIHSQADLDNAALLPEIPTIVGYGMVEDPAQSDVLPDLLRLCVTLRTKVAMEPGKEHSFEMCVESAHPYKEAAIFRREVRFAPAVQWVLVCLDRRSCTSQPEDKVLVMDGDGDVCRVFSCKRWPDRPFVVKGSSVTFELSTATDYIKNPESEKNRFGFAATCTGQCGQQLQSRPASILDSFESGIMFQVLNNVHALVIESNSASGWLASQQAKAQSMRSDCLLKNGLQNAALDGIDADVLGKDNGVAFRAFADDFILLKEGTPGNRLADWFAALPDAKREPTAAEPEAEAEVAAAQPEAEPESIPHECADDLTRRVFCGLLWHHGAWNDAMLASLHCKFRSTDEFPLLLKLLADAWRAVSTHVRSALLEKKNGGVSQMVSRAKFLLLMKSSTEILPVHDVHALSPDDEERPEALGRAASARLPPATSPIDVPGGLSRTQSNAAPAPRLEEDLSTSSTAGLQSLAKDTCFDSELASKCLTFVWHGNSPGFLVRLAAESTRVAIARLKGLQVLYAMMQLADATGVSEMIMYNSVWCLARSLLDPTLAEAHVLSGLWLTSEMKQALTAAFHNVLGYSVKALQSPGHDQMLIRAALRCFSCTLLPADHGFLEQSQVLSYIGQIERAASSPGAGKSDLSAAEFPPPVINGLQDLTEGEQYVAKSSSNQDMIRSLFDNSTETFWEADGQDVAPDITMTLTDGQMPVGAIRVHVDNARDNDRKCTTINLERGAPGCKTLHFSVKIPSSFGGWIAFGGWIGDDVQPKLYTYKITIEGGGMANQDFGGPMIRSNPRLRGIKLFGSQMEMPIENGYRSTSVLISEEAISLFRSLARAVIFKDLAQDDEDKADEGG